MRFCSGEGGLQGDAVSEEECVVELDSLDAEFVEEVEFFGLRQGAGFGLGDEGVELLEGIAKGWGGQFDVGGVVSFWEFVLHA